MSRPLDWRRAQPLRPSQDVDEQDVPDIFKRVFSHRRQQARQPSKQELRALADAAIQEFKGRKAAEPVQTDLVEYIAGLDHKEGDANG